MHPPQRLMLLLGHVSDLWYGFSKLSVVKIAGNLDCEVSVAVKWCHVDKLTRHL